MKHFLLTGFYILLMYNLSSQKTNIFKFYDDYNKWQTFADTTKVRVILDTVKLLTKAGKFQRGIDLSRWAYQLSKGNDSLLAETQYTIGKLKLSAGDLDSSKMYLDRNINFILKKFGKENVFYANTINALGVYYLNKGNYQEAINKYRESLAINLKIREPNDLQVANNYNNIGVVYYQLQKLDSVSYYMQKALNIKLKSKNTDYISIVDSYNNLGTVEDKRQNFRNANSFYFKGIRLLKSNNENNDLRLKTLYANIGNIYVQTEMLDSAIYYHSKAYDYAVKIYGKDNINTAYDLRNLSIDYIEKGEYQNAITKLNKAIQITKLELGENHLDLAKFYYSLGSAYFFIGNNSLALSYYQKSLEIKLNQPDPPKISIAESYQNIANVMSNIGNLSNAVDTLQKAIKIIKQELGEESLQLADMYNNIATNYGKLGHELMALDYYKKALNIRKNSLKDDTPSMSESFNNLGIAYKALDSIELAEKYLNKSLEVKQKVFGNSNYNTAFGYLKLAELYVKTKTWSKALTNLHLSQQVIQNMEKQRGLNVVDLNLSIDALKNERLYYEQIQNNRKLDSLDKLLNRRLKELVMKSEDIVDKNFVLEKTQNFYNSMIDFQYNFNPKSAFETSERSKYRLFNELISREENIQYTAIPDSIIQHKKRILTDITYYENLLHDKSSSNTLSDSLKKIYDDKIFNLKHKGQNLTEEIKREYPYFYELKYNGKSPSVESVQKMLSKNQTLIEYYVSDTVLYTFVIGKYTFGLSKLNLPNDWEETISSIRRLTQSITNVGNSTSEQKYLKSAFKAFQVLINPVKEKLTKELIIIPDGKLSYLSFDALVTNETNSFAKAQYMIDTYQISYEYSTKLWTYMKERRGKASKKLIAFSPKFPNPNYDWKKIDSISQSYAVRDGLWELVHSKKECENIAALWDTKLVLDSIATLNNFLTWASDYQIIHLSTHGLADDRTGEFSYIAFTHVNDTLIDKLFVRDLYNVKLNADLVVLSACQTGIGAYKNGEGVISMALGFAYAGAKSIVSTLWSINDKSTEQIITGLYKYLKDGKSKDEALRLAKLDYRKANPNSAPFYWASFIVIGDMKPIDNQSFVYRIVMFSLISLLILFGIYKSIRKKNT